MSTSNVVLSKASNQFQAYLPDVIRLFDETTLWLISRGITEQWGDEAPSNRPCFLERATRFLEQAEERKMTMIPARANENSPIIGILVFNEAPSPNSAGERELFIYWVLTTRDPSYRGLGRRLVAEAIQEARQRKIRLLRLSCYASEDRKLIKVYEEMGFRMNPDEIFLTRVWEEKIWPKAILEMKLEELLGE